jgi:membrane-bound serine protease (ClpP class)
MFKKPVTGREGMIGLKATVIEPLDPQGTVKVKGELWKASSVDSKTGINVNEEVIVIAIEGLRLIVRRKEKDE